MSVEEFIQHQAVSGCLTMEDRQYLELRDVQKVIQMAREEERSKLTLKGRVVKQDNNLLDRATLVMKIRSSSPVYTNEAFDYLRAKGLGQYIGGMVDEWRWSDSHSNCWNLPTAELANIYQTYCQHE